jgi:hypothetical protein
MAQGAAKVNDKRKAFGAPPLPLDEETTAEAQTLAEAGK